MGNVFNTSRRNNDTNLINPFIENRTDVCPNCKSQRVELFSFNNYTQNYREAVNMYLNGHDVNFDKYELRAMKCKSCGKEFVIDWSSGFPKPLRNTFKTNMFLAEFVLGI